MAVIDELEGLEAWVEINGKRVQEYNNPNDDDGDNDMQLLVSATKIENPDTLYVRDVPHVVKYIEAIPEQNFKIHFKKAEGFTRHCNHLGVEWTVDKTSTAIQHETFSQRGRKAEWKAVAGGIMSGDDDIGWTGNSFKFSEVKHVETYDLTTESLDKSIVNAKRYGLIAVIVYRMSASEVTKHKWRGGSPPVGLPQEVPEKALKGATVTNCTIFDQVPAPRPEWADEDQDDVYQDLLRRPCAVFEFRYRSKEGLYQEGVLERPDPVDDMSPEELRRLARIGLNHENDGAAKQDPDKKIKQEYGGDAVNPKRSASGTAESPRKRYKETIRDDGKVEVDLE